MTAAVAVAVGVVLGQTISYSGSSSMGLLLCSIAVPVNRDAAYTPAAEKIWLVGEEAN